jgi:hypothetical protein
MAERDVGRINCTNELVFNVQVMLELSIILEQHCNKQKVLNDEGIYKIIGSSTWRW